ncbi:sigma-70 family RNA polymerase sigma factor [Chitinophaga sp. SYP-B3965]|uniref:RNA polymerase sigma factor n=1 Tax=Chitinophaga sp. SYP-B3965 TaxID=2663120 RepID=UPI0012998573|nr:sigma-70 family RNA polymerase sigma factor [Chitinophaga sp. SYP-B3965]MRG48195.1 sigma-70 family RNA polymerase sigma factor [Chitinophaga sp. SYP-B3965]
MSRTLEDLPDNLLLRQCKEGSEAAFNVLFRRYFDDLLQFAAWQLKDHELAEELVMDLMLKLWQQDPDTAEIQHLGQYLFRSVKNSIISQWRKKALSFIPIEDLAESGEPLTRSADYQLMDSEAATIYQGKLAELSPQRRLVYTMSREQEMTHAEIALETNLSIHTVKNHVKASLHYFRENLKPYTEITFILLSFLF